MEEIHELEAVPVLATPAVRAQPLAREMPLAEEQFDGKQPPPCPPLTMCLLLGLTPLFVLLLRFVFGGVGSIRRPCPAVRCTHSAGYLTPSLTPYLLPLTSYLLPWKERAQKPKTQSTKTLWSSLPPLLLGLCALFVCSFAAGQKTPTKQKQQGTFGSLLLVFFFCFCSIFSHVFKFFSVVESTWGCC